MPKWISSGSFDSQPHIETETWAVCCLPKAAVNGGRTAVADGDRPIAPGNGTTLPPISELVHPTDVKSELEAEHRHTMAPARQRVELRPTALAARAAGCRRLNPAQILNRRRKLGMETAKLLHKEGTNLPEGLSPGVADPSQLPCCFGGLSACSRCLSLSSSAPVAFVLVPSLSPGV